MEWWGRNEGSIRTVGQGARGKCNSRESFLAGGLVRVAFRVGLLPHNCPAEIIDLENGGLLRRRRAGLRHMSLVGCPRTYLRFDLDFITRREERGLKLCHLLNNTVSLGVLHTKKL